MLPAGPGKVGKLERHCFATSPGELSFYRPALTSSEAAARVYGEKGRDGVLGVTRFKTRASMRSSVDALKQTQAFDHRGILGVVRGVKHAALRKQR